MVGQAVVREYIATEGVREGSRGLSGVFRRSAPCSGGVFGGWRGGWLRFRPKEGGAWWWSSRVEDASYLDAVARIGYYEPGDDPGQRLF